MRLGPCIWLHSKKQAYVTRKVEETQSRIHSELPSSKVFGAHIVGSSSKKKAGLEWPSQKEVN